jgi:hypothetical protein
VFAALVAIVALITALAAVFEKRRKDEEELERYLDGSIQ